MRLFCRGGGDGVTTMEYDGMAGWSVVGVEWVGGGGGVLGGAVRVVVILLSLLLLKAVWHVHVLNCIEWAFRKHTSSFKNARVHEHVATHTCNKTCNKHVIMNCIITSSTRHQPRPDLVTFHPHTKCPPLL